MGCATSKGSYRVEPTSSWVHPIQLDQSVTKQFMELDQFGKVQIEYVWMDSDYLDHNGMSFDLCSKGLTVDEKPESAEDLPVWNFGGEDPPGSGDHVDVKLVPKKIYKDPFRKGDNILVLAETYSEPQRGSSEVYGPPTSWNTRAECAALMSKAATAGHDPWFGIEQEYFLMDLRVDKPLGWPDTTSRPDEDVSFYCSVGATTVIGRDIVEAHYRACIYAGIKIGGINSEDEPSQWEYQVGPCPGVDCADDMWMSRYILQRVCEMYNVRVSFDPKPVQGRAGIGCHTNYSTKATRTAPGGMEEMKSQIDNLRLRHKEHMDVYGKGNERRMTGKDHTASMSDFSWGVGDRGVSVRINVKCEREDCGFYEDRRPAANMDPYLVTQALVETTLFFEETLSKSGLKQSLKFEDPLAPEIHPTAVWAAPRKRSNEPTSHDPMKGG